VSNAEQVDLVVIGAGIVGLATARAALLQQPGLRVVVLDKEGAIAGHQTGRNSGVIHAGVYYKPGSAKAAMCTAGRDRMVTFCNERGVPHEVCGKLVVAVDEIERQRLDELQARCEANGVTVTRLSPAAMRDIEPHVAGVDALHVPSTGIVDYGRVCDEFVHDLTAMGADVRLSSPFHDAVGTDRELVVRAGDTEYVCRSVVNCGGLHADRIARSFGGPEAAKGMTIIPFRGEYFELAPARRHLVRGLIYPAPDPRFPFLGVHLTRSVHGGVHVGPNAVLALAREGYSWRVIEPADIGETLRAPGFRTLARQHWRYGLHEMTRSLSRRSFARALARLVPDVAAADLEPAASGVRAQAVHADGRLADDFELHRSNGGRVLHVLNAPSPAATASLAIGDRLASEALTALR
jgi:L-2-hydroxyglutarate oxidase